MTVAGPTVAAPGPTVTVTVEPDPADGGEFDGDGSAAGDDVAPDTEESDDSGNATDPRFPTCAKANSAGYGPYVTGVDPEYDWYVDRDSDGVVCER